MNGVCLARPLALLSTLALGVWLAPLTATAQPPPGPAPAPIPSPVAGQTLSLQEAIQIALERQPQIQARLSDYEAAKARVGQALAPILPQIGGSWTAIRQKTEFFRGAIGGAAAEPIPLFSTTQTARVTLSQILFDFGKAFAATDAAKAQAEVSRLDAEIQKDLIVLAVKESYFNLLFSQRLVKVNQQALERAELNLRSAKGFFEVGTRPKSDVTRAEVDVANARLKIIQARNAVRLARVALNTAMGIKVDAPTEVKDILTFEKYSIDPSQLVSAALRERAEYRRVNALVISADASIRRAFRDFFPDFTGSGSYGGTFRNPRTPDDLAETWELSVTLNWSLFDGGNKVAKYKEAKASLDASQARVRALELDIWKEVEQAHSAFIETEERIQAAQASVASAQENFKLAQGRFDAGVGTILELTDAQLALTEAQSTEAQALADYRIAIARLERALGRR